MLFTEQISLKPNLYPWTDKFIEATQANLWTDKEFSFKSDVQDFKIHLTDQERTSIIRSLSMIGQVEIAVKKFWSKLGDTFPHPSINDLGYVLAYTETVHGLAYSRLLEVLGIENAFDDNLKLPLIKGRVSYLRKHLEKYSQDDKKQFIYSIILFTLFIENVSLFSQFYIVNWFRKEKNILKDTCKQIEYTFREEECFIDGTEVLTPFGWKKISSLTVGDYVVQYNKNGTLEYSKVLNTTEKNYCGPMYEFFRKGQKCVVTPNHDMIVYYDKVDCRKVEAKNVKFHKRMSIPTSAPLVDGFIKSTTDELSFEDRLRIAIQADGTNSYWVNSAGVKVLRGINGGFTHSIIVKKQRKVDRLRWILSNLVIPYKEYPIDSRGCTKFSIQYNHSFNYKEFKWVDLLNKSTNWCKQFIDECSKWDGFIRADTGTLNYSTTHKENLDLVQAIAVLAGYTTTISHKIDNRAEAFSDSWRISFKTSDPFPISHGMNKKIVDYSGKVSCITVSSGAILTRYKDATFIAGNCHTLVGIKLIQTLQHEYPELFDDELKNKILQEVKTAIEYESQIVDWILNGISVIDLNSNTIQHFIRNRMNFALKEIGYGEPFYVDPFEIEKTKWFDELLHSNSMTDFFDSRPVEYTKNNNYDDLFDD